MLHVQIKNKMEVSQLPLLFFMSSKKSATCNSQINYDQEKENVESSTEKPNTFIYGKSCFYKAHENAI